MKKSKKIILRSMPIVMACLTIVTMLTTMPVYAVTSGVDPNYPTGGNQFTTVSTLGGSLWSTITLIAQIAAFAAIIFAGLRYMFASADQKADIKKQTIILVVGAVLVFGASLVVNILTNVLNDVENNLP